MLSPPKVVFFDLDETLVQNVIPIQQLFAQIYFQFKEELISDKTITDPQDIFFATLRSHTSVVWNTMFDGQGSPEQKLIYCFSQSILSIKPMPENAADRLGKNMFNRFVSLSANNVRLQDDALATLAALKNAGFTTGVITNGIEQLQMAKIKQLNLPNAVDHIIVSAHAGAHKPDKKVFLHALDKASVDAHQAWQVGDHAANDVAGAIRAGMGGVFYDPTGKKHKTAFAELNEIPTHRISSLYEIVALLTE